MLNLCKNVNTAQNHHMAKKVKQQEMSGAQDLYNYLFEACNIIRGPVSQDNIKDYLTPLLA